MPGAMDTMHYDPKAQHADADAGAQEPVTGLAALGGEDEAARPAKKMRAKKAEPARAAATPEGTKRAKTVGCIGLPVQYHTGTDLLPATLYRRTNNGGPDCWDLKYTPAGSTNPARRYNVRHADRPTPGCWNFLPGWTFTGTDDPADLPGKQVTVDMAPKLQENMGEAIYLKLAGKEQGPYGESQIGDMLSRAHIGPGTLGRRDGSDEWHALRVLIPETVQKIITKA